MKRESAIVQRLVNALDDAQSVYGKQASGVLDPHLQDWLERTADIHWVIADELGDQMVAAGLLATRRGGHHGPVRALLAGWFARNSFDTDMACASDAARREAGVLGRVRDATTLVRDTVLRNRLHAHQHEIERASTQICCLLSTMQLRVNPHTARAVMIAHVSARPSALPIVMQVRPQARA